MISPHVWDAFLPPIRHSAVEWIPANVWMPPNTEHDGMFDFDVAPHTRGVLEAWDDPEVREITLCWATRNMKTSTVISLMIFAAATSPCSMALGSCTEQKIDEVITEQFYPMLERCEATRDLLPPPNRRGKNSIELKNCRIRKAFSGSPGSVAGYPAEIVGLNEYSKWTHSKSTEADTARGFLQRGKGFPYTSKAIKESSPADIATCRVWKDIHAPTTDRRTYNVQCPHCGNYQLLEFGDRDSPFGIKWERPKSGHSDPLRVEATAYYLCRHKGCKIHSEERAVMMRTGVWLSEGLSIDKNGRVKGKRKVQSSHIGFGPLSSLYSLLISGWGQIAKDFILCGKDPEKLKDFWNSTLALVWDPKPKIVLPHELAVRLCDAAHHRGICPDWTVFLTRGSDVQQDADLFIWDVLAWGCKGRTAVIDWGETYGRDAFREMLRDTHYTAADGGPPFPVNGTLLDTGDGDMTEILYEFCKSAVRCRPGKGASHKFVPWYDENPLNAEKYGSKFKGMQLITVNTHRTQRYLEGHFKGLHTDPESAFTLPIEASLDEEYLEQLLAEVLTDGKWEETGPNHHRDAIRYAVTLAMKLTRGGSTFHNLVPRSLYDDQRGQQRESIFTSGGGRQWPNGNG